MGLADDVFGDDDAPAVAPSPVAPAPPPSPRPKAAPAAPSALAAPDGAASLFEAVRSCLAVLVDRIGETDAALVGPTVETALRALDKLEELAARLGDDEQISTLQLAHSILQRILPRLDTADPVRFASLAEKALGAIGRIEVALKARPQGPSVEQQIRARLTKIERETHDLVEQYVVAAEDEAARLGVCVTCGAPLVAPLDAPPAWPEVAA